MSDKSRFTNIHYQEYLQLDKILGAQKMRSAELGVAAHDEELFIITHQVYELWFKQILHELTSVSSMFFESEVDEKNMGVAIARLNRIAEIQLLMIDQVRILETMTPLDFLEFRNHLFPASGFQSFQFRLVEVLLGLKNNQRITYNKKPYYEPFDEKQQKKLLQLGERSMFELIEAWLERTPFLQFEGFDFVSSYQEAVSRMVEKERAQIEGSTLRGPEKDQRLKMLGDTDTYYQIIFDEDKHEKMRKDGELRLSYKATIAALLINLYRDEPILHQPFRLLTCLITIDENFTTWRYRHAQMVLRMLGKKIGTGGSSGYDYLHSTAVKHHIFTDFHNISTLLIPRSELPELPPKVKQLLGFYYSDKSK